MFKFLKKSKAQTATEYTTLLIIIIGALLTIQVYMKRSFQGRLKAAADDIGEQYSPGNTNVTRRVTSDSVTLETLENGVTRSEINDRPEIYWVNEGTVIQNVDQEYWGGGSGFCFPLDSIPQGGDCSKCCSGACHNKCLPPGLVCFQVCN